MTEEIKEKITPAKNIEEQEKLKGTPLYGANLVLPITDLANPIIQIHYKIGTRIYIKNAI